MQVASVRILNRLSWSARAAMLRAGCVGLFVCVSACGGGDGGAPPPSSMPATASTPAPNPPPLAPTPAPGTALSIDSGASGNPVSLRVARSANGDGFAVWLAYDGTRHNLWANRYRAAAAAWGNAVSIETSAADILNFDLSVDPSGNAVVVWGEPPRSRVVMSVRFNEQRRRVGRAGAAGRHSDPPRPLVASDGSGAVLVVWTPSVNGRYFDPASGVWQERSDRAGQLRHRRQQQSGANIGRQRQCARRLSQRAKKRGAY